MVILLFTTVIADKIYDGAVRNLADAHRKIQSRTVADLIILIVLRIYYVSVYYVCFNNNNNNI